MKKQSTTLEDKRLRLTQLEGKRLIITSKVERLQKHCELVETEIKTLEARIAIDESLDPQIVK